MKMQFKHKLWIITAIWMVLCGAVGVMFRLSAGDALATAGMGKIRPIVVIDPGHGGADGGAVGVGGVQEKEINLALSHKLRCLFELGGFEVIMTRETDISIHDPGITTLRKQKTSDLHNRLAIAQGHPGALFISIHQNKFSVSKYWGAQVFYGPQNPDSRQLAQLIQSSIREGLQTENTREIKQAEKNLFLVYNLENPAVLVECGFLSNPTESARLQEPDYQDALAFCIYKAAVEYLG
jgi:N-acetylmuramoyl-L-alanine amidase